MAPMTRSRAQEDGTPGELAALYYAQRATMGLLITGMQDIPVPRELSQEDIQTTISDFRKAVAAAIEAGADGVEIHGVNGYLINQFLGENSNTRTDEYGGSIENRARFAIEVTKAIAQEIGAERTAFRIRQEHRWVVAKMVNKVLIFIAIL